MFARKRWVNRMTNDELFTELSELLMAREAVLEAPDAHDFDEKCRALLVGAIGLARELCGDIVLKAAAGEVGEGAERSEILRALASRIDLASYLYISLPDDAADLNHAHDEIRFIAGGDKPVLFDKLPGPKTKLRVYFRKLNALAWYAYLEGLGLPVVERQSAISTAFGHPWDTIARWDAVPRAAEGNSWVDQHLAKYRRRGIDRIALWEMKEGESWEEALKRAGKEFHQTTKLSSDQR